MSKSPSASRPLPIIHLNAFPGTGKLTIAQHLVKQFKLGSIKLVHNHLLINPADAVLHREQAGYQKLRGAIRAAIFSSLINEPATFSSVYVFTDFQAANDLGRATCEEYAACAIARGCDFIPIALHCDEEVNLDRLATGTRADSGKLVDRDLVRRFRQNANLYSFEGDTATWELDVSGLSVEEASAALQRYVVESAPEMATLVQDEK